MDPLALQPTATQHEGALDTTPPTTRNYQTFQQSPALERWYSPLDEAGRLEDIELYRPGGFHPMMPFDFLGDNKRFEVWTKLGQGAFGIVWLCYDNKKEKFCAVKILRSDTSSQGEISRELKISDMIREISVAEAWKNHVAMPAEHFWQHGPNGLHLCLVMPILGPPISRARDYNWHDTPLLKNICFQLTECMAFLHRHNICHGDFRPANILFKTTLDDLTLEEMDTYMPNPRAHEILRLDGGEASPHAPKYAIEPMYLELEDRYITRDIAIIDFGVAFDASSPPRHSSIPEAGAAPENQPEIDAPPAVSGDLWALGITISQTLCGVAPFTIFNEAFSWSTVEEALGPIPEPYRSKLIQQDSYKIHGNKLSIHSPLLSSPCSINMTERQRKERPAAEDFFYDIIARKTENLHPDWNDTTKKIEQRILKGSNMIEEMDGILQGGCEGLDNSDMDDQQDNDALDGRASSRNIVESTSLHPPCIIRQLDAAAVQGAVDILKQLLRWDPEDRIPAEQLLDHEWFEGRNTKKSKSGILSEQEGGVSKADLNSNLLAKQEHSPESMDGDNVALPGEEATKGPNLLRHASVPQETETEPNDKDIAPMAQDELLLGVEPCSDENNTDNESLYKVDISLGAEDYEEPQDESKQRWSFAFSLVAGDISI